MEPYSAGWLSIVPPIIAITLALTTKEVLSSLALGILSGALIYAVGTDMNLLMGTLQVTFETMVKRVDFEIILFCSLLGALVYVVAMSGASRAYGKWAAEEASPEFAVMQGDMYNLFPAVGSVNAIRSNYRYTQFEPERPNTFGSCEMRIHDRRAEPPARARGRIARAMLYMQDRYPEYYQLSAQDRRLADAWNRTYPVTPLECRIAARIEVVQQNPNRFVKTPCLEKGWYKTTGALH